MKNSIKLSIVALALVSTMANAQSFGNKKIKGNGNVITQKRSTTAYDEVKVAGFFDVNLVSGTEGAITIQGEENLLASIKIVVEGNVLKIYTENGKSINASKGKKIVITVPFETISQVSLSGSGDVKTQNKIKASTFVAQLSGSGYLTLDVDATQFEASLSGSGDIVLSGNAENFNSKLAGSGDIDASGLKAKNVDTVISGSGDSKVFCSESLKARVSGSGDIEYKGDPKNKDTKVNGSGEISKA